MFLQAYSTLIEANQDHLSLESRKKLLDTITNEHVLKAGPNTYEYCLEKLILEEVKLLPVTLFLMIESDNLLWNALPGLIPKMNIEDESIIHKIWYKKGKEVQLLRQKIGSALLYFCPYGGSYVLRSAHTLLPEIKRFISDSQLRRVTDNELEEFINQYNERMGNDNCFIVNYPSYINKAGKIKPMMLTPQDIAQKHQEITEYFEKALAESQTVEDCFAIRQWLDKREETDYYVPGVEGTITMFRKRTQDRITYLENTAHEEKEREKKKQEQLVLDKIIERLKAAATKIALLQLRDDAKKELIGAKGNQYREQLNSVISRIESKIAELEKGYVFTKLPFKDNLPGLEDKDLESVLKVFYEIAWRRIQTREYGIPGNCRIPITPQVLKEYSYALVNESGSRFLCKVYNSNGSSFNLNIYDQQPTVNLVLLNIYLVANIADIVKGREVVAATTDPYPEQQGREALNEAKPGKDSRHRSKRKYPSLHQQPSGKPTGEGTPHRTKTPYQVVWHYRSIGIKRSSLNALVNALKYTGIAYIPKGYTFVRPQVRNTDQGEIFDEVVVETELAASLTKTLDLYFKN